MRITISVFALCLLLVGCQNAVPVKSPLKDGLKLEYSVGDSQFSTPYTLSFAKLSNNSYKMSREGTTDTTVDQFFNTNGLYKQLRFQGGPVWVDPDKLAKGGEIYSSEGEMWIVSGLEQKGSYEAYRMEIKFVSAEAGDSDIAWYDKRNGLMVANELQHGNETLYTSLTNSNAE